MERISTGRVGIVAANILEQFEAVGAVERDIDDQDVGLTLGDCMHCRLRFFRFAADHQIRLAD